MRTLIFCIASILLLTGNIHQVSAQSGPLNGTYSIGSAGYYSTITAAVDSLASKGVSGPVIFNIASGDYNEQVTIPQIPGTSVVNTITFQSQMLDSTLVRIYYYGNYNNNFVLWLNGADHIIFRKLTIEPTNDYYGKGIVVENGANYNRFESNIIRHYNASCGEGCNIENALVYSDPYSGIYNNYNEFKNNLFENNITGIYLSYSIGLLIEKNTFSNQVTNAIYLQSQDSFTVFANIISNSSSENPLALNIYSSKNFSITKNKINILNTGSGIHLESCNHIVGNTSLIANNFISVVPNSTGYALSISSSDNIKVLYNSLNLHGSNYNLSMALQLNASSAITLKNNVAKNSCSGYAIYNNYPQSADSSDYNNFYSSGIYLANWGSNLNTLSALKLTSGKDQHSISVNSAFLSNYDLHAGDLSLNAKGIRLSRISDDIDGNIRNLSTPDIGADEFSPPAVDAGINSLTDNTPFVRGEKNISVNLSNNGINPLLSVTIHWTLNGVIQSEIPWTGNLPSGAMTAIDLGNQQFLTHQDNILKCWTSLPNGTADNYNYNDTLIVNLRPAIGGEYTIGGTNPDFATFNAAVNFLQNQFLADHVIFKVRNGTYNEQVYFYNLTGTKSTSTVTFESESGDSSQVILSFSSDYNYNNYVLFLNSNYITFSKITLRALNSNYGRVLQISNAQHNTFKNCVFQGISVYSGENGAVIYSAGYYSDNYNQFLNNRIVNGTYGIFYYGLYNANEKGTRIEGNIFENQNNDAIYISYQDSVIIHKNSISANSSYYDFQGIMCANSSNKLRITENRINITGNGNGIYLNSSNHNLNSQALVANNFISVPQNGIVLSSSEFVDVYHNTVKIRASGGRALEIGSYNNTAGNVNIINNIFASFHLYGYPYFVTETSVINSSDYNNFYTAGQYLAHFPVPGDLNNLSALKSATGKDLHSISIDPAFVSDNNLHVTEPALKNSGFPLAYITTDIDGDARNPITPDIGADEFIISTQYNAGIYTVEGLTQPLPTGTHNVKAVIKNYGSTTLTNIAINWSINNVAQPNYNWTGSLSTGDTITAIIGTYNFEIKTAYTLICNTSLPNGQPDPVNTNDTVHVTNFYAALAGIYTLGGTTPDFSSFTEAISALTHGGINGPVTFKVRPGTYTEQLTIKTILGSSPVNSILFESETGDNTSVVLNYTANYTDNYTIRFDAASYIGFNKISIQALDANYGNVIDIINNNQNITLSNCILRNETLGSNIIESTGSSADYCRFINNRIVNGSYGLYFVSSTKAIHIENNNFENQTYAGIYLNNNYPDTVIIRKNILLANPTSSNYNALTIISYYCRRLSIEKNRIEMPGGGTGMRLVNFSTLSKPAGLVSNNFIHIGGIYYSVGISCENAYSLILSNNSVNITNTATNSRAFYVYHSYNTSIDLENNILVNSGGGYSLYSYSANLLGITDYNDLYATGTNLAYWGADISNLATLKSVSSKNIHSISVNPQFISDTDLHVQDASLNNTGSPITGVIDDIDGETRNILKPDIGADEFNITYATDAGIASLESLNMPFSAGIKSVLVSLKNYGIDNLTTVAIDWSINNIQQSRYTWTGALVSGDTTRINLGNYSFDIKENYSIKSWTVLPNGQSDPGITNDTLFITGLYAALNGTYTIGGSNPQFNNFTEAVHTLSFGGIIGPVVFKARPGIYTEQIIMPKITGTSATNTITFESENGDSTAVVIRFNSAAANNYTWQFNTASNVKLNKLTLQALNATYANVITNYGTNKRLKISNCKITTVSGSNGYLFYLASSIDSSFIENNLIENGSTGLYVGYGSAGVLITNNQFKDQNFRGMDIYNNNGTVLSGNQITGNQTSNSAYNAISLYGSSNFKITKNKIDIRNSGIGINIYNGNGSLAEPALVANNFVHVAGNSGSDGINLSGNYLEICYNSINITNTDPGSSALKGGGSNVAFKNNNLVNPGGGYSMINYYGYINYSDYNNLYTTGTNLAYFNGDRLNLTDLRAASNQEQHSVSANPKYISSSDLHVAEVALNGAGIPTALISDDIDGEQRNATFPDIGADEFNSNLHDIGIAALLPTSGCILGNNVPVKVTVKNYGEFDETNFIVAYSFENSGIVSTTYLQTLAAGASAEVSFTETINFAALKSYRLKAFIIYIADENKLNDTLVNFVDNMPKLQITLSNDTSICTYSSTTLTASGAGFYIWSTGQTTPSINVSPQTETSYSVKAWNQFNCETNDTVTVRLYPLPKKPVISPSGNISICNDSSVVLTSDITENIIWSTNETTHSILVTGTGNFAVSYTDSLGCSSTSLAVYVFKEEAPKLIPSDTTICSSVALTLRVQNAATYLWNTGATSKSIVINPASTTTYSVNATTALGCSKFLTGKVNVLPSKTPAAVSGMLPTDATEGLSLPLELSWLPSANTNNHDIYVWPANETEPAIPFESNVTGIRYTIPKDKLEYGITYNWQVISKYYGCESTLGPVQSFNLRYLPDLVVTNVQAPKSAYTGQEVEVTWDILNQGTGSTINQPWYDQITLSLDSTMADDFYTLGNKSNFTYLEPGQSYSKKASFKLPDYKDGLFTVFAKANFTSTLLETNKQNNIGGSAERTMVSLAPVPDLYVSEIYSPSNFFSEDTINLTWKVINKGKWKTDKLSWTDRVYLSQDYDNSKRHFLGDFVHKGDTLKPNETYSANNAVVIPEGVFGNYFFYVETDYGNAIQEHAYDGNNLSQGDSLNVVLRPPADLEVTDIVIPKTTTNIGTAKIQWTVNNLGNSSPSDKNWTDAVYISKLPVFDASRSYYFSFRRTANPNGIQSGMKYTSSEDIQIPNDIIPGDYFVYVKTDNSDNVFEYTFNENNLLRSDSTVKITIAPYPDLTVTGINVPDSAGAGQEIPVSFMVENIGTASAKEGWTDIVYIVDNTNATIQLKDIKRFDKLDAGASYIVSTRVNLPSGINYGSDKYKIFAATNADNKLYEHKQDNNNKRADTLFIIPSDLSVTELTAPEILYTGTEVKIKYTVTNNGNVNSPAKYWEDRVDILDNLQRGVLNNNYTNIISGAVKSGENYTVDQIIKIPEGLTPGTYNLRVKCDNYNTNGERIISNNYRIIPVRIELRQPTDLIIQSFTAPTAGTSGQPITISWTVKNAGAGSTLAALWTDLIVLSTDTIIDGGDINLLNYQKSGGLLSGGSYSQSKQAFLPANTVGNYYLIIKTDYQNPYYGSYYGNEYEMNAENNNTQITVFTITKAPPSDLVVTAISAPPSAVTGEPVTIGWTIKNNGPNKASGYLTDMVYFSKDTEWDVNDAFFGENFEKINLAAGSDTTVTISSELTGAADGDYYVIVRTDNKNNINEINDYNNTLSSVSQVVVETPLLQLNVNEENILKNSKGLYYRIEIPDSLVDETLLVTLKGDTISGVNDLYISYDRLPDRSDYDFNSKVASYGNQEVIIPTLKKGNYYLLVYGNVTPGEQQNITLRAEKINFQIRTVDANKGGNLGTVTTQLYGAKFTSGMKVLLVNPEYSVTAESLIFIDATKVFVSFGLRNAPLGFYDVMAINSAGDTALLKNGFEAEQNSPFGLVTSVKSPAAMVAGSKATIAVQFANEGNIDLAIPKFKLISINGLPIALMKKDLDKNQKVVEFELHEVNGPQNVLRPGAVNSLYIWVYATIGGRCEFKFE
jgi:parallel beta-helix repeat protein